MQKNNLKILPYKNVLKYELILINIEEVISATHPTLKKKLQFILDYNLYLLEENISISYLEYLQKNGEDDYEASASDITNINKYLEIYENEKKLIFFIEPQSKILKKNYKLTLTDLCIAFNKFDKEIIEEEIESISSIKIYDYYQNKEEKNKSLQSINSILKLKEVQNLEIISIINTIETHSFLENLVKNKNDYNRLDIKYMRNTKSQYISNLFFMLIKYKLKDEKKYKNYIFYLEPQINHALAGFIDNNNFSSSFFRLLKERFTLQFLDERNIDFIKNLKIHNSKLTIEDFKQSLHEIFKEIRLLIDNPINNDESKYIEIEQKTDALKIQYPKMYYSFKLVNNVLKSVILSKKIANAQSKQTELNNVTAVIQNIFEYKIYSKVRSLLNNIKDKEENKSKKINIFKLRQGLYSKPIGNTNKAFVDIFNDLNWSSIDNIEFSLNSIKYDDEKLTRLLASLEYTDKELTMEQKKEIYENKILKDLFLGRSIKL